jgi:ABC-type multidrug transport system ATPase subunit
VAVLDAGRIIAQGTVAQLKARHGRTRLDVRPLHPGDARRVLAAVAHPGATDGAGAVHVELPSPDAAREVTAIVARLRDQQIELASIAVRESSLEDVFVELTGSEIAA